MTTLKQAAETALKVLNYYEPIHQDDMMYEAIDALKEALAQHDEECEAGPSPQERRMAEE